jgi:hypothetical protein
MLIKFNFKLKSKLNESIQNVQDGNGKTVNINTYPLPTREKLVTAIEKYSSDSNLITVFDDYLELLKKYNSYYLVLILLTLILIISSIIFFK